MRYSKSVITWADGWPIPTNLGTLDINQDGKLVYPENPNTPIGSAIYWSPSGKLNDDPGRVVFKIERSMKS